MLYRIWILIVSLQKLLLRPPEAQMPTWVAQEMDRADCSWPRKRVVAPVERELILEWKNFYSRMNHHFPDHYLSKSWDWWWYKHEICYRAEFLTCFSPFTKGSSRDFRVKVTQDGHQLFLPLVVLFFVHGVMKRILTSLNVCYKSSLDS